MTTGGAVLAAICCHRTQTGTVAVTSQQLEDILKYFQELISKTDTLINREAPDINLGDLNVDLTPLRELLAGQYAKVEGWMEAITNSSSAISISAEKVATTLESVVSAMSVLHTDIKEFYGSSLDVLESINSEVVQIRDLLLQQAEGDDQTRDLIRICMTAIQSIEVKLKQRYKYPYKFFRRFQLNGSFKIVLPKGCVWTKAQVNNYFAGCDAICDWAENSLIWVRTFVENGDGTFRIVDEDLPPNALEWAKTFQDSGGITRLAHRTVVFFPAIAKMEALVQAEFDLDVAEQIVPIRVEESDADANANGVKLPAYYFRGAPAAVDPEAPVEEGGTDEPPADEPPATNEPPADDTPPATDEPPADDTPPAAEEQAS